ncbi:MAG TPA: universal stress protein [Desulfobaccales bacterium]|jgi:nucleotide-binding universal stress UspA family protein|nr:universal stress protein [Desulfobaccales bacterium]
MEVRTILWPTDLSKNSIKAAKHVSSLALKYQAKIILMYVGVDLLSYFRAYGDPSKDQLEHFQSWELKQAKKHLEGVCEQELKACPNIEVKLVQGDAASEILKAIKETKADMVVLTSHGRGQEDLDQKSADFGSVAKKILANSPVPVHLVNPHTK